MGSTVKVDGSIDALSETFRGRIADLKDAPAEALLPELMLGCGVLMGGGFPGCAAALATLIDRQYPGQTRWLWDIDK